MTNAGLDALLRNIEKAGEESQKSQKAWERDRKERKERQEYARDQEQMRKLKEFAHSEKAKLEEKRRMEAQELEKQRRMKAQEREKERREKEKKESEFEAEEVDSEYRDASCRSTSLESITIDESLPDSHQNRTYKVWNASHRTKPKGKGRSVIGLKARARGTLDMPQPSSLAQKRAAPEPEDSVSEQLPSVAGAGKKRLKFTTPSAVSKTPQGASISGPPSPQKSQATGPKKTAIPSSLNASKAIPDSVVIVFDARREQWRYDNGKTEKQWVPWIEIKRNLVGCVLVVQNIDNAAWEGGLVTDWVKDRLWGAAKLQTVEVILQYVSGRVEDRFFDKKGNARYQPGLKKSVHEIALKLWDYPYIKKVGFFTGIKLEKGKLYKYRRLQSLKRTDAVWGGWVEEYKPWLQ